MLLNELTSRPAEINWKKTPKGFQGRFLIGDDEYKIVANKKPLDVLVDEISDEINYWAEKDPAHASEQAEKAQAFLNKLDRTGANDFMTYVMTDKEGSMEMTGGGNARPVFATVMKSFGELAKQGGTNIFSFTAREESRKKFYDRFFKNNEKYTYVDKDGVKEYIILV